MLQFPFPGLGRQRQEVEVVRVFDELLGEIWGGEADVEGQVRVRPRIRASCRGPPTSS